MATTSKVNPSDPRPAFQQLADALRSEYEPGSKLPSTNELTAEWGVSVALVRSAIKILRDEGLATYIPRRGVFYVAERPATRSETTADSPATLASDLRELADQVNELARRADALERNDEK